MYEPLQKSGHSPWRVQSLAGSNWPSDSRPVYVDQNWVERKSPPNVSAQQESTLRGFARLEQDNTESVSAGESCQQHRFIVALAQATDSKRKCGWRCSRCREQRMPPLRRAKLQQLWNASREIDQRQLCVEQSHTLPHPPLIYLHHILLFANYEAILQMQIGHGRKACSD